ncbi:hypothetical protein [Rhizobium sp. 2MFCol3.1]|uniref:hypothetical protein n=1 Tax=Rhizobium sp. 2MFCol3.1 TaxID=1246459 RepID=UPI00036A3891|nr:hypothetical protein [Rhizobium sp. 2MFCol3.1]
MSLVAMSELSDPLRDYMRVVRILNIYKRRLILLSDKVAKTSGSRKIFHVGRLRAVQDEIAALLDEGDRHLARLRDAWLRQRDQT